MVIVINDTPYVANQVVESTCFDGSSEGNCLAVTPDAKY
jgi:hypothetical protein